MSFAAGVIAGIVATALVAFLVFKARVISGQTNVRLPDLRLTIAILALIIAIVALARSGKTTSTTASDTTTTTEAFVDPTPTTTHGASTTTTSTAAGGGLTTVTVPNVIGVSQATAIDRLHQAGLDAKVQLLPLTSVPAGYVVTQSPVAFATATSHSTVEIGVSSGG